VIGVYLSPIDIFNVMKNRNEALLELLSRTAEVSNSRNLNKLCSYLNEKLEHNSYYGYQGLKLPEWALNELHSSTLPEARKLAAKLFLTTTHQFKSLLNDCDFGVKLEAAKRCSYMTLKRISERDDRFSYLLDERFKSLHEASETAKKVAEKPVEKLKLSKVFYDNLALRFISDYRNEIDGSINPGFVKTYCSSYKSTYSIEIDEKQLMDSIKKELKKREDSVLKDE
jgi:hypothetical protein